MAETITPVVYGGRTRWIGGWALHVAGATITAVVFGALLGSVGNAVGAPFGSAGLVALAAVALIYAAGTTPWIAVPIPQLRRQVPEWWRTFFPLGVAAFLYGAGLGIGFLTFLATGALVVVALAAALSGSAIAGALIVGTFGLVRGVSVIVGANVRTAEDGRRLVDRATEHRDLTRRVSAGVALVAVAVAAVAAVPHAARGGAGPLAAATVAAVFAAAATAKLVEPRRWRRTIAAHGLPRPLERAAAAGVPLAELGVPALALIGLASGASWWAMVLVVGFSVEIAWVVVRRGSMVACGCFGGARARPAWHLLTRNAAVGALAIAGAVGSMNASIFAWPGPPSASEVLPFLLAAVGIALAAGAGLIVWGSLSRERP